MDSLSWHSSSLRMAPANLKAQSMLRREKHPLMFMPSFIDGWWTNSTRAMEEFLNGVWLGEILNSARFLLHRCMHGEVCAECSKLACRGLNYKEQVPTCHCPRNNPTTVRLLNVFGGGLGSLSARACPWNRLRLGGLPPVVANSSFPLPFSFVLMRLLS